MSDTQRHHFNLFNCWHLCMPVVLFLKKNLEYFVFSRNMSKKTADFFAFNDQTKIKNGPAVFLICYSTIGGLLEFSLIHVFIINSMFSWCILCFLYACWMLSMFSWCVPCFLYGFLVTVSLDKFHVFFDVFRVFSMCYLLVLIRFMCFLMCFMMLFFVFASWCAPSFLDVFLVSLDVFSFVPFILDVFHVFMILCTMFSWFISCFLDLFHVFLLCSMSSWCVPCFLNVFLVSLDKFHAFLLCFMLSWWV